MSEHATLIASRLCKSFGAKTIVDAVDLELRPHTITALLGPSGAGKSTVLRMLAGLEDLDSGEIRIGDVVMSKKGYTQAPEARRTGLIFQDFALFPHMTAAQNIRFGLNRMPQAESVALARRWLARLGLEARANAFPHQLSGGEQQRVAIARALAPNPRAMLMDEPFSGLDPQLRASVADITLDAVRESGPPALLVSHDASAAMQRADSIAIMRDGRIVQSGTPGEVYDHPGDAEIAAALGPVTNVLASALPAGLAPTGTAPGAMVTLREEAIVWDSASSTTMTVESIARVGAGSRVKLRHGDTVVHARMPRGHMPEPGTQLPVSLDPTGTFIFTGS